MQLLLNFSAFQMGWLSSVVGGARQMPWLGPLVVLVALLIHLRAARKPFDEVILVFVCAVIGAIFDSLLVAAGWVAYPSGTFASALAPYWIITMWMLFATTLNVSMRWLRDRVRLAAVLGLLGGPAAYLAGEEFGGIALVERVPALVALAIGWTVILPVLLRLSEMFDGMPGPRRVWLEERI